MISLLPTDAPANAANFDQIWDLRFSATPEQPGRDIYDSTLKTVFYLWLQNTVLRRYNDRKEQLIKQMGGGDTKIATDIFGGARDANDTSVDGQNNIPADNLTFDQAVLVQ